MKEKSMTKIHGGGAIIENRPLRKNHWEENHREEIIEERGICEASGRPMGGIWEVSGWHLGGTLDSRRPGGSRKLKTIKNDAPVS